MGAAHTDGNKGKNAMSVTAQVSRRRLAWCGLLAVAVLLVALAPDELAPPVASLNVDDEQAQLPWPVARLQVRHADGDEPAPRSLFAHAVPGASGLATDPPPVASVPTTSAAVSAPTRAPPPGIVMGRMEADGQHIVFLQIGTHNLQYVAAREGDRIDGDYVVHRLEGRRVTLRHRASGRLSTVQMDDNH
jgi:hypothetical protein